MKPIFLPSKIKILSLGLIITIGLFLIFGTRISRGQDFLGQESVPVNDAEVIKILKELREKELGTSPNSDFYQRKLANKRLLEASRYIVNLIKSLGRKTGSANSGSAYVQNWRGFLAGGQYRGEDVARGLIADATLGANPTICGYLRNSLNTSFTVKDLPAGFDSSKYRLDSLQYYKLQNQCTLPADFDADIFGTDFAKGGGWDAWNKLIQPQNNFFGVYGATLDELSKQRSFEEHLDTSEVAAGSGYIGRTECQVMGQNNECLAWKNIDFPANVAAEALGAVINQNLAWITGSDEVNELLDVYIFEVVNAIFGTGEIRGQ